MDSIASNDLLELGFNLENEDLENLFWRFSLTIDGVTLILSWSLTERSMQTTLKHRSDGAVITTVCSEGLVESRVGASDIQARFNLGEFTTTLKIGFVDSIKVEWSTLEIG